MSESVTPSPATPTPSLPLQTDVLIVGAGPTGLSLAVQLLRYGIDFVICDQKEGVTELSKALVVHARTLEIYDQVGLAQAAVTGGEVVQKFTVLHHGTQRGQLEFARLGEGLSPFPFVLIFEQSKNEHLLFDHVQQHGHTVRWKTDLQGLHQDNEGVSAVLQGNDGQQQTVRARYVVGCDGASSTTRHQLGLSFEGSTFPRLFYVADVDMESDLDHSSLYLVPSDHSFGVLFPMQGDKHWRLLGNLPEYEHEGKIDEQVPYDVIEAKVKEQVQRPLHIQNVRWFSTYKVHTRHAEKFSQGRCFLAGDAAHIHTPAGGQGMNTGIQDAYNLAWKLALVLKGQASEGLLETYNEERLANAKRLLHTTDELFDVMAGENWYQHLFRDILLPTLMPLVAGSPTAKQFVFPLLSQIGINYHESSLSQHEGDHHFKVKAGDRMPYFEIEGQSIYERLNAPRFHIVLFSNDERGELKAHLTSKYGEWLDFTPVPLSPNITEIFGTSQPFLALLRPDNYIALLSPTISSAPIEAFFWRLALSHSQ